MRFSSCPGILKNTPLWFCRDCFPVFIINLVNTVLLLVLTIHTHWSTLTLPLSFSLSRTTRPLSQADLLNSENRETPPGPVGNGTPEQSLQQTNGTAMHSEPLAEVQSPTAKEHEAPSTSGQSHHKSVIGQRAMSQQASVDFASTTSPLSKVRFLHRKN